MPPFTTLASPKDSAKRNSSVPIVVGVIVPLVFVGCAVASILILFYIYWRRRNKCKSANHGHYNSCVLYVISRESVTSSSG